MSIDTERADLLKIVENSSIKIKLNNQGRNLAVATVILASVLEINGWRVSESKFDDTPYVQPPSSQGKDDKWYRVIWINDDEIRKVIECKVLEAYQEKFLEEEGSSIGF